MKQGIDYTGIGCGAVILNDKGQILLMKRAKHLKIAPDVWGKPGGKLEYGEKIEDAVKREVLEEIGVKVEVKNFIGYIEECFDDMHWVGFNYWCEIIDDKEPQNLEPEKCDEIRWFDLDKLPTNIHFAASEPLKQMKEKGWI